MKVVLNQDVKGVGKKLQIVEVSEGYARNFLLPKKLAVVADNKNLKRKQNLKLQMKIKKLLKMDLLNLDIKLVKEVSFMEVLQKKI